MSAPAPQESVGRYAVTGHPVEHSLSPLIHGQFAADTGQALVYDLLSAGLDDFAPTVASFFAAIPGDTPAGINITLPFKEQAAAWVHTLDPAAQLAGAVNTIHRAADGSFVGYNTTSVEAAAAAVPVCLRNLSLGRLLLYACALV